LAQKHEENGELEKYLDECEKVYDLSMKLLEPGPSILARAVRASIAFGNSCFKVAKHYKEAGMLVEAGLVIGRLANKTCSAQFYSILQRSFDIADKQGRNMYIQELKNYTACVEAALEKDPNNAGCWIFLAYYLSPVTQKKKTQAYKRAAELGNKEAIRTLEGQK